MISFQNIRYAYPRQTQATLSNFDWHVPAGTFALITGPSGSGKSTIARCVNGLVPHFHGGRFGGATLVGGIDTRTRGTADLSLRAGFVAQDPESQTITDKVEDEIAFGPENHGLTRQEIRLRVEETLDLLGIAGLRDREIATLSGGERQRVVIGSAMAMRPEILVLDEPTSQLDPWGAEEVLTILDRLNSDLGTTIVLVEHRLDRVLASADRLLILQDDGRVIGDGSTRKMVERLPNPPPLVQLARGLGWHPIPMTVRDARASHAADSQELPPEPPATSPTGGETTLEFERVSFSFGDRSVLRDVSTTFQAGTITALMGRNGSGKTTLLKHVNGLLRPERGRVKLLGEVIDQRQTVDLASIVGYLPQNPGAMLFNETVESELEFTLRCQRRTGDTSDLLHRLGIEHLSDQHPFDLSGGERQRAALAAVLISNPRVLLLDEPTRGMDNRRKQELGLLLGSLAQDGVTVILATHDVELVASFADRVLLIGNGEIIADGAPHSVLPGSLTFAPQTNRVFGGRYLVPDDVLGRAGATAE